MKARVRKRNKKKVVLVSVAESIGSTLGSIAARANVAQRVFSRNPVGRAVKRGRKTLMRKNKEAGAKARHSTSANPKRSARGHSARIA